MQEIFLWEYFKSKVVANNPNSFVELKFEIRCIIGRIDPRIGKNLIKNFKDQILQPYHGWSFDIIHLNSE